MSSPDTTVMPAPGCGAGQRRRPPGVDHVEQDAGWAAGTVAAATSPAERRQGRDDHVVTGGDPRAQPGHGPVADAGAQVERPRQQVGGPAGVAGPHGERGDAELGQRQHGRAGRGTGAQHQRARRASAQVRAQRPHDPDDVGVRGVPPAVVAAHQGVDGGGPAAPRHRPWSRPRRRPPSAAWSATARATAGPARRRTPPARRRRPRGRRTPSPSARPRRSRRGAAPVRGSARWASRGPPPSLHRSPAAWPCTRRSARRRCALCSARVVRELGLTGDRVDRDEEEPRRRRPGWPPPRSRPRPGC